MKKMLVAATALVLLSAPAFARYGEQNADGARSSQTLQSAGRLRMATSEPAETTAKKNAKSRKRKMNSNSGNCWNSANPACQNYRPR